MAQSSDNTIQGQVYASLKQLEEVPASYQYLAYVFANPNIDISIRKMGGLTMSAALKRNSSFLHFETNILAAIKQTILSVSHPELANSQSILISSLVTLDSFDYQLMSFLIQGIQEQPSNIKMVNTILEDLKLNN